MKCIIDTEHDLRNAFTLLWYVNGVYTYTIMLCKWQVAVAVGLLLASGAVELVKMSKMYIYTYYLLVTM